MALVIVVVLTTMQVIANLYLPFLNADIINNGVVTGDVGYIVRVGAIMLGLSLGLAVISVRPRRAGEPVPIGGTLQPA